MVHIVIAKKSANNYFQRKSYSMQKKSHLVKPFIICTTDGLIVDVYGMFEATKNDATILTEIFEKRSLKDLVQKDDIFLVDRGFRDCVATLKSEHGLQVNMPSFIDSDCKQLSTFEANKTRLIRKCRWVIEAINRFFKETFRALSEVRNKTLLHILCDFKIAASLVNRFLKRLYSDAGFSLELAKKMKSRLSCENDLKD